MKYPILYAVIFLLFFTERLVCQSENSHPVTAIASSKTIDFTANGDIYGTRSFVENKGQFHLGSQTSDSILFLYEHAGEKIFFTKQGLIYEFVKSYPLSERQLEAIEEGKKVKTKDPHYYYAFMNWPGFSADSVKISGAEKQLNYFTYGTEELNAYTYKKIIYKNIYPNIDIEYSIPSNRTSGIEYAFILRPGANPANIKILYSGDVKKISENKQQEIQIKTSLTNIVEHVPTSFYDDGKSILSAFKLNGDTILFELENNLDKNRTRIIDPWVTSITTLPFNDCAYDVDYDFAGNAFIYGGSPLPKVAKYNPNGTLLWTFSGTLISPSWSSVGSGTFVGNFVVHKFSGKCYIGQGVNTSGTGSKIIRLSSTGSYDNFITSNNYLNQEVWDMGFRCTTGEIFVLGGGHSSNSSAGIISGNTPNILLTTFQPTNTNWVHDIASHAVDDNGNLFVYYSTASNVALNNRICSVNSTFNGSNWLQASGFNVLGEVANKLNYITPSSPLSSGGYNCLAVNNNFVFYYDGIHLAAYSKLSGALLATLTTSLNPKQQGGIAVDACNRVYVGGNGSILHYSFTGTGFILISTIPIVTNSPFAFVYDLRLNENTQTLFACGSGFIGAYNVAASAVCRTYSGICSMSQLGMSITSSSIGCLSNGSATITMAGGTGPFTYTWLPSAQTGSIATGLNAGTYTVFILDVGTNLSYSTTTVFNSPYNFTGYVTSHLCYGSVGTATVFNVSGGMTSPKYIWTNGVWTQTTSTAYLSGLSAGNYTVNVIDSISGCGFISTFSVSTNPQISHTINLTSPSVCVGQTIFLNVLVNGGTPYYYAPAYTYSWSTGSLTPFISVNQTIPGNYTYTFTSSDSKNCSQTSIVTLTFYPNPLITVANATICSQSLGSITAFGANSYTWSTNIIGNTLVQMPLSTTVYSVIGASYGCTASAQASLVVKPSPIISLTNNSPICEGDSLKLHGEGGLSYSWQGPLSFTSTGQNVAIPSTHATNAGVYQLTVTGVNGCTATTSDYYTINPSPPLTAHGTTVCLGDNIYMNSNTLPGATYSWNGPASFTSSLQNPFILNSVQANSGNYQVMIQSTQGCTNTAVANVSVAPPPTLSVSFSNNGNLCAQAFNGSQNSMILTPFGATNYTLLSAANISVSFATNTSSLISILPPILNPVETLTLLGSDGLCTSSLSVTFSVVNNPQIVISNVSPSICAGESFTFHITGASTYSWNSNSSGLSNFTGSLTIASPSATSVYSVFGSNNGCYSPTQTCTLTVKPLPQAILAPVQPSICFGAQVTLKAFSSATSFTWSPDSLLLPLHGSVIIVHPKHTQTYTVNMELNQCFNYTTITVVVIPQPTASAVAITSVVCLNEPVQLFGLGGTSYSWECPDHTFIQSQNIITLAANIVKSGIYTLTVANPLGCKDSATIRININDLPKGELVLSSHVTCVPFCTAFNFLNQAPSASKLIDWNFNQQTYTSKSFSYCFSSAGNSVVTCRLLDTLTSCKNTMTFVVSAYDRPYADFSFSPEKPVVDLDEVTFTNHSRGDNQAYYTWFFASNASENTFEQKINHSFFEQGMYAIAMIVTDMNGCSDTAIKTITVIPDDAIYVPNVFTPNGDKINDVFKAVSTGIKTFKLEIYDRWGEHIVESSDLNSGWDGTYKGLDCAVGVYIWKIYAVAVNGTTKNLSGHVTLAR